MNKSDENEQLNTDDENKEILEIDNGQTITDEIDTVLKERDHYKNIAQRAQADLVNFKNRVAEERESTYVIIVSRFVSNLLPILDNFNRAVTSMPTDDLWFQGFQMIEKSLHDLIESEGITKTATPGIEFDPNLHEAIMAIEDNTKKDGTIADIIAQGYKLKDRIIRPAQVTVIRNKAKEDDIIEEENQSNSSKDEGENNNG
jgi:molecular chaperone GrpE